MKRNLTFYKSWLNGFRFKDILPVFRYTKNVQGWFFTRNYTFELFTYALNYSIVINSDLSIDRMVAHDTNISKYSN